MKYMRKHTWVKLVALLLAAVSGLILISAGTTTIIFGTIPETQMKQADMETAIQRQILEGYGNYLLQNNGIMNVERGMEDEVEWDGLNGGNIRYTVVRKDSTSDKATVLYTNDSAVDESSAQALVSLREGSHTASRVQQASMWSLLLCYGQENWYWTEDWRIRQTSGIVYNEEDGLFYAAGVNGNYYVMNEFLRCVEKNLTIEDDGVDMEELFRGYTLKEKEGVSAYYSDEGDEIVNQETLRQWMEEDNIFWFGGYSTSFVMNSTEDSYIECVERIPDENKLIADEYNLHEDGTIEYDVSTIRGDQIVSYEIYLSTADVLGNTTWLKNGVKDYMNDVHTLVKFICWFRNTSGLWTAVSAIVFVACFVFLMKAAGRRKESDEIRVIWMDRIPYGILVFAGGMLVVGGAALACLCIEMFYEMRLTFSLGLAGALCFAIASALIFLLVCMSTAVRIKTHHFWNYTICHQLCRPFRWLGSMLHENMSLTVKTGAILGGVALLELLVLSSDDCGVTIPLFFLFKCVEIPFLISLIVKMNKILEGGKRMVGGDYSQPIDTAHMRGPLKEHADNMNNIGQGISRAVDEQMKSERFKTELITNVSHDIKTPLTSIINYVDLMEKEEIDNPKVQEYLEVLDRQSARLKKLIEDLMEASKASTGNLKVDLQMCDATVMLTQVVGEFEDRSKKNTLDIVVNSPEPPANIMADGRHLWRVIDNLMSNICKYAQPGTRVYIDLEKYNGMVIMTFRNTSRYQLNISSEELMERFVRGDSSRNTEGSGLGLSIAQSLTTLMGGNFAIQIDGDLFKAILSFEECK